MAEHLRHEEKRGAISDKEARECMASIVHANVAHFGGLQRVGVVDLPHAHAVEQLQPRGSSQATPPSTIT
jgi:hypothetical protein